ncbi:SDR family oxidoreductase [Aestuariicella sp. G3-2]|uniref:SDR family oxidoreductase n=1 Tax=Pseudomaricurvus albidus TaxID=2842452 RepID=UPI001C0BC5DF|nr:SDR family oxidoreductase [Aestuariicella albida]MBU3069769.1 SDR family oxidoreductase [Aestuariicella albida]
MQSDVVVITGANRGIGLSLARLYANQGHAVYAVCRQTSPELSALKLNVIDGIDITNPSDIHRLQQSLSGVTIQLLINNAGILREEDFGQLNSESIREQFETNALAPILLTEALAGNLSTGSKIAFITSRMSSIADNNSGGYYGYRMSKAALNVAAKSITVAMKPRKISVAILHPGLVGTDMIGGYGDITPDEAAQRLSQRIEELTLENSGRFLHANGEQLPW